MTYQEKKVIADTYIGNKAGGIGWDDLADINSLHDAEDEAEIIELCDERLAEEGFPVEDSE